MNKFKKFTVCVVDINEFKEVEIILSRLGYNFLINYIGSLYQYIVAKEDGNVDTYFSRPYYKCPIPIDKYPMITLSDLGRLLNANEKVDGKNKFEKFIIGLNNTTSISIEIFDTLFINGYKVYLKQQTEGFDYIVCHENGRVSLYFKSEYYKMIEENKGYGQINIHEFRILFNNDEHKHKHDKEYENDIPDVKENNIILKCGDCKGDISLKPITSKLNEDITQVLKDILYTKQNNPELDIESYIKGILYTKT